MWGEALQCFQLRQPPRLISVLVSAVVFPVHDSCSSRRLVGVYGGATTVEICSSPSPLSYGRCMKLFSMEMPVMPLVETFDCCRTHLSYTYSTPFHCPFQPDAGLGDGVDRPWVIPLLVD